MPFHPERLRLPGLSSHSLYRLARYPVAYLLISLALVSLVVGWVAWQSFEHIETDREAPLVKALSSYAFTLEGGTTNSQAMGAAILFGLDNPAAKLAAQGRLPADAPAVIAGLDVLRKQFLVDEALLLDSSADVIAQSGGGTSRLGRNLAFRPYIRMALQGTPSVYPAVSDAGHDRGIYLAAPLRSGANGRSAVIGAVVVKIGSDKLDLLLQSWEGGAALLVSPEGVVFAASRKDWLFRTVGMLDAARREDIRRAGQFGPAFGQGASALPFGLDEPDVMLDGVRYAVRTLPVDWNDPAGDWRLALFESRPPWWMHWSVLVLAGLAGLLAAMALLWLFNLARNAVLLDNLNAQLRRSGEVLAEKERLLREAQSIAGLGSYVLHFPSREWESSEVLDELFGIDASYPHTDEGWRALLHPDDRKRVVEHFEHDVLACLEPFDQEFRIIRYADKSERWVHGLGKLQFDGEGRPRQMHGTLQDITERKRVEADLRIASVAFESQEPMLITDAEGVIQRVNQAFMDSTGFLAEDVIGQTPRVLKSGRHNRDFYRKMWEQVRETGTWHGEIWDRNKRGDVYPKLLTISAVKGEDGLVTHYVGAHIDITERKRAEEEVKYLAFFDPLTKLPNRRLLMDRLQQAMASSMRSGRQVALLFIDLDNFKNLNDTLGHDKGDLLLQQVAKRLTSCVRDGDTVARLGGDEFVVMLEGLSVDELEAAGQVEASGEKILAVLRSPYLLGNHEFRSSSSIGVTLFSGYRQSVEELLKQADIAMYQSKRVGRNTLRFFDPQMQDIINVRAELEAELHKAIDLGQFQLYYQVQMDSRHQPVGAEALIRWISPTRGVVSPVQFIPLAEETGLIAPIGAWVLETACAQLKAWSGDAATRDLVLSVNISAKQFHQVDFVAQIRDSVARHGIRADHLKLELTESMLLEDIEETIATMQALKATGVLISLDDFGTGYSSLQYLKRLPLDQLKIDQSFVRDLALDSSDKAIVRTIIAMAHSMRLDVIAEGVETEEQLHFLKESGCRHCQGYLFGRPLPLDEFNAMLARG